jgi:hypothetical protein
MAIAKIKYQADDALNNIHGALTKELAIHAFNEKKRSKIHLFSVNGTVGRQFAIVLGDLDEKTGKFAREQTRIILERCEVPSFDGVELINKPYKSARLKNLDSKISPPNQTSVFVHHENALKGLLRWYAENK